MRRAIVLAVILTMVPVQSLGSAAEFADRGLDAPAYAEILRGVELFASSQVVSDDNVDHLIYLLRAVEPGDFAFGSVARFVGLGLTDPVFTEELDAFIAENGGRKQAARLLREHPESFMSRPRMVQLTARVTEVLYDDARLFLRAAKRVETQNDIRYRPKDHPVSEDDVLRGEARDIKSTSSAIAAGIAAAAAACASIPVFGPIIAAILQEIAAVFAILTPIEGQAEGKVAGPLKDMAEGLKRAASQPATTDYLGVAATTLKECERLVDRGERKACLKAALLLIGNSF